MSDVMPVCLCAQNLRASIERGTTEPQKKLKEASAFESEQLHTMLDAMKEDFRAREDALHAAIQSINAELVKAHAANQGLEMALQEAKRQPQVVSASTAQDEVVKLREELAALVAKLRATQQELATLKQTASDKEREAEELLSQHLQDAELGYSMQILQLKQENASLKAKRRDSEAISCV